VGNKTFAGNVVIVPRRNLTVTIGPQAQPAAGSLALFLGKDNL
jgi:hypothetical protein